MKQLILTAALCCGLIPATFAQRKTPISLDELDSLTSPHQAKRHRSSPPAINEIDRLYKKYKGVDSMLITNVNGSFYAHISVEFNTEGKPQSITLKGESTNIETVKLFIKDLKEDRESKGYTLQPPSSDITSYNGDTYVKGSLYTRFNQFTMTWDDIRESHLKGSPSISFTIENGDVKRIAGSKATKVDF